MTGSLGTDAESTGAEKLVEVPRVDERLPPRSPGDRASAAIMSDLREGVGMRTNIRRDQLSRRALFLADVCAFAVAIVVLSLAPTDRCRSPGSGSPAC